MITDLISQLKRDEGVRLKPYLDTEMKVTIGVGRNLTDVGINDEELELLLHNDVQHAKNMLEQNLPWAIGLDAVRYAVLVNMCFNMGIGSLLQFKNTLELIKNGNYVTAAQEMLQSKWATQVGPRAVRLSLQLSLGEWQ